MAAGLGFKTFAVGEVLSAANVNGYLMQGIWVFANAAARDAAVTSPQEGNACYLKDTDVIQVYTGSTWAAQSASNPISGNIVDAKGDLIVATAADTVSRLGVGTNNQVLTADSSTATGLKWATPAAGGGKILQVIQDTVSGEVSTTSGSFVDTGLDVTITPAATGSRILLIATCGNVAKLNGNVNNSVYLELVRGTTQIYFGADGTHFTNTDGYLYAGPISFSYVDSPSTTSATTYKVRFRSYISGQTSIINKSTSGSSTIQSTLIAMEIGA